MKIRTAVPGDLAVIADFNIKLAWESEHLKLDPKVVTPGVARVLQDKTKGIYFLAEMDGTIAGQLMITYEWSDWRNGTIWWIQSVFVKEDFRGQGVFKALFEHTAELARKAGDVCALRLYMEKNNERARRAYLKMGMTETAYEVLEVRVIQIPAG